MLLGFILRAAKLLTHNRNEYVQVMIKTQKTMQEIQSELCELEVEEGKAK
jgi:hypothetical protein